MERSGRTLGCLFAPPSAERFLPVLLRFDRFPVPGTGWGNSDQLLAGAALLGAKQDEAAKAGLVPINEKSECRVECFLDECAQGEPRTVAVANVRHRGSGPWALKHL